MPRPPAFSAHIGSLSSRVFSGLAAKAADLRASGATALGSIERADPVEAVELRVRREEYDEVIVSTLPRTVSRWLKMDLPSKVERAIGTAVTTIIAKDM